MKTTDISQHMLEADMIINTAISEVTHALVKILAKGGIPIDRAINYTAQPVSGGEWILNNVENTLADHDIQIKDNKSIVRIVKELEGMK